MEPPDVHHHHHHHQLRRVSGGGVHDSPVPKDVLLGGKGELLLLECLESPDGRRERGHRAVARAQLLLDRVDGAAHLGNLAVAAVASAS